MALLRVAGVRAAHRDRHHGSVDADSTIEHSCLQGLGASFSAASAGAAAVASTVLEAFVRWRSSSLIHPLGSRPASVSRASVDRARVSRARMHRARVLSARAPSVWTQRAAKRAWPSVHGRGRGSMAAGTSAVDRQLACPTCVWTQRVGALRVGLRALAPVWCCGARVSCVSRPCVGSWRHAASLC